MKPVFRISCDEIQDILYACLVAIDYAKDHVDDEEIENLMDHLLWDEGITRAYRAIYYMNQVLTAPKPPVHGDC